LRLAAVLIAELSREKALQPATLVGLSAPRSLPDHEQRTNYTRAARMDGLSSSAAPSSIATLISNDSAQLRNSSQTARQLPSLTLSRWRFGGLPVYSDVLRTSLAAPNPTLSAIQKP
jgi:hypothetical protein